MRLSIWALYKCNMYIKGTYRHVKMVLHSNDSGIQRCDLMKAINQ